MGFSLKRTLRRVSSNINHAATNVYRDARGVVQSGINVAATPLRTADVIIHGGSRTDIAKELGKGIGASANVITFGTYQDKGVKKFLGSKEVNFLSLGTGKEFNKSAQGFKKLENKKTVKSDFYQSVGSIALKAAAVGTVASYVTPAAHGIEVTSQTGGLGFGVAPTATVTSTSLAPAGTALATGAQYAGYAAIAGKILKAKNPLAAAADQVVPGSGQYFDGGSGGGVSYDPQTGMPIQKNSPLLLVAGALVLFLVLKMK